MTTEATGEEEGKNPTRACVGMEVLYRLQHLRGSRRRRIERRKPTSIILQ